MEKRINKFRWLAGVIITAFVLTVLIRTFVFSYATVDGLSMYPTFENGEVVAVYKLPYLVRDPKAGEVVVATEPIHGQCVIKRIAAGPGDTVTTKEGLTYRLGVNEYYLRGDNEAQSLDSDNYGPVLRDHIIGKVKDKSTP